MTPRPRLQSLQVNSTDYDGDIVIEQFSYWSMQDGPSWAVPAWDESGASNLAGPFASHAEAQAALDAEMSQ